MILNHDGCVSYDSSWSPDGTRIAYACRDSFIRLVDVSDGTVASHFGCEDYVTSVSWSPVGDRIAYSCGGYASHRDLGLNVIDLDDGVITQLTYEGSAEYTGAAWSPDGSKIAFASDLDGDFEIYVVEVER